MCVYTYMCMHVCMCVCVCIYVYVLSHFSCVCLSATLWTVASQSPLFMGFPRQEYWSGLLCPPPRDLPNPGIRPASPLSPALQVNSLPAEPLGEAQVIYI